MRPSRLQPLCGLRLRTALCSVCSPLQPFGPPMLASSFAVLLASLGSSSYYGLRFAGHGIPAACVTPFWACPRPSTPSGLRARLTTRQLISALDRRRPSVRPVSRLRRHAFLNSAWSSHTFAPPCANACAVSPPLRTSLRSVSSGLQPLRGLRRSQARLRHSLLHWGLRTGLRFASPVFRGCGRPLGCSSIQHGRPTPSHRPALTLARCSAPADFASLRVLGAPAASRPPTLASSLAALPASLGLLRPVSRTARGLRAPLAPPPLRGFDGLTSRCFAHSARASCAPLRKGSLLDSATP